MAAQTPDAFRAAQWIATATGLEARHAQFQAADAGATRARILEVSDGRCRFSVGDSKQHLQFHGAHARAGRIALKFLSWTGSAHCETSVERTRDHHLALHIALRGGFTAEQDGRVVRVHPGQMLVVSAPGRVVRTWGGACDLLNVMIARPSHAGAERSDAIVDRPMALLDLRRERTLARFIETLVQDFGEEEPLFGDPAAAAQAERMLLMLLTRSLRGSHPAITDGIGSKIAPYYVRRAEAFIAHHHARPVTLSEVARACGISLRTLHHGFSTYRAYTPSERLRSVRLAAARAALGTQDLPISGIAQAVGYRSASQFARDYKAAFGESPSVTRRYAAR